MIYYSKNPIVTTIEDVATGYKVELEIFVEETLFSGLTVSLGIFQFIASGTTLTQRVDSELDVYLSNRIKNTIPGIAALDDGAAFTDKLSTRFRVDYRVNDGSGFDAWQTGDVHWLLYGGQPWEEFINEFSTDAAGQITWLHPGGPGLCSVLAPMFLFFVVPVTGEFSYFFTFYDFSGNPTDGEEVVMEAENNFQIVQIPIQLPELSQSPKFKITVSKDLIRSAECELKVLRNMNPSYSIAWLNARGGWSYADFDERLTSGLEVAQDISSANPGANYYSGSMADSIVYKTMGRKKFRVASGFTVSEDLEIMIQDLMLSPYRFLWSQRLEKWIPIIITTKNAEYFSDGDYLKSAVIDFQTAFENNLPGKL
jgi:hypothetical protein